MTHDLQMFVLDPLSAEDCLQGMTMRGDTLLIDIHTLYTYRCKYVFDDINSFRYYMDVPDARKIMLPSWYAAHKKWEVAFKGGNGALPEYNVRKVAT